jgi:hypothetical protein
MRVRKRLFVDHKVQGALMLRAVEYWFCCVLTVGLALLGRNLITGSSESFYDYLLDACHYFLTAGVVSILVLPLLIYDALKLSNKFTGPLFRLRRELRRLAAGEHVPPIRFRSRDFWVAMADEFNAASERMDMLATLAEKGRKAPNPAHRGTAAENLQTGTLSSGKRGGEETTPRSTSSSALADLELPEQLFDLPRNKR